MNIKNTNRLQQNEDERKITEAQGKLNKTRTSKIAQNVFLVKKLEIFENQFSFKKSSIVPKKLEGGPLRTY